MEFEIVFDREDDGRWIAEIESLPGVLAYGTTQLEAQSKVEALALARGGGSGSWHSAARPRLSPRIYLRTYRRLFMAKVMKSARGYPLKLRSKLV